MIINSPILNENKSGYRVRFYDYDGTLLKQQYVASGGSVIAPANPSHTGLTFQEWNNSFTNITRNLDVGATFTPTDGKTHAFVSVNAITGLNVTLYLTKSDASTLTVNWGDGTTTTHTNNGAFKTGAHTYSAAGDYEITLDITSGSGTYNLGNNSFVGNSTSPGADSLIHLWIGEDARMSVNYTCYLNKCLRTVVIPNTVTTLGYGAFYTCHALQAIIVPSGVTSIPARFASIILTNCVIVLPSGITSFGDYAFSQALLGELVLPASLTTINQYALSGCTSLGEELDFPAGLTTIGTYAFNECRALPGVVNLPSITTIGTYAFYYCMAIEGFIFGDAITAIPNYFAQYATNVSTVILGDSTQSVGAGAFNHLYSTETLTIPATVTTISTSAFGGPYVMREVIVEPTTPPTLGTTVFGATPHSQFKIYVPDASVAAYKAATNWITYANYIYSINDR